MISTPTLILAVIVTCIAFIIAFSRVLDPEMGGGLRGLVRSITRRTLMIIAALLALMAALPWVGGLVSDDVDAILVPGGILVAMAGTFVVARQFPQGWSSFVAVVALIACVWVGAYSLYLASAAGWQDMTLDDVGGGDGEPPWTIIGIIGIGTIVAPLPGLLIGIIARRPAPETPVR